LIYAQILVGATMRHTGAGLAIPDFPLMFGRLVPDHWDPKIAIQFAHRVGAVIVTLAIVATTGYVGRHDRRNRGQ
jgi:cytochrome c oxidase assembly protein subunit 15